jgi:hypothetical protein
LWAAGCACANLLLWLGDDLHPVDQCRLGGVGGGDEDAADRLLVGRRGNGQDAVDVAHGAVERELADEERVLDGLGPDLLRGDEHAYGGGQVVGRPGPADVGRSQVDGDALATTKHGQQAMAS